MQLAEENTNWDEVCRCATAGFDWCVSRGEQSRERGELDAALGWLSLAAWSAGGCAFFGAVASLKIESELARCHAQISQPLFQSPPTGLRRFLHVMDEAYVIGGHTALCSRWIETRSGIERHSVLLLNQREVLSDKLKTAVEAAGGNIRMLSPGLGLAERARQLRLAACEQADVVVLHTHPDSVVPAAAFSQPGGPPVIVLNHADHLFQATGAIADLVLEIRDSGEEWTRECRGIGATTIVPIPLIDPLDEKAVENIESEKRAAREQLGLPQDAVILLTVASAFKYTPTRNLSFCRSIQPVLLANPGALLVAVGPEDDGEWRWLWKTTGGRVRALGRRENLSPFHRSADIYIEGFPIGSLTAMLEAGLASLPCVRAPRVVPPPFCSDGIAFEANPQPVSVEEFAEQISRLIRDGEERRRQGRLMRESIKQHHCLPGWVKYLEQALKKIPRTHCTNAARIINTVPVAPRNYWLSRLHGIAGNPGWEDIGATILAEAVSRGLPVRNEDYAGLGRVMRRRSVEAGIGSMAEGLSPHRISSEGNGNRSAARRLEWRTQMKLRRRRLLRLWEKGKEGLLRRMGVVGLARKIGRTLVGDLRR